MTEAPLLEVAALTVRRAGATLLEEVGFTLAPATIGAVIGPNGAGKSTLLQAVLGQCAFDGSVRCHFRGAGRIGFVPQSFEVDRGLPLTVADFLAATVARRPVCFGLGAARRRAIEAQLAAASLAPLFHRPLGALSGGELQRVLLLVALDPLPELLILDEPASGLDPGALEKLEADLREARAKGTTVLMVSHDLGQVRRLADRVLVLNRRLLRSGPPAEVLGADLPALLWPGIAGVAG